VWRPSNEVIESSNVYLFMSKHGINSTDELVRLSYDEPQWFWRTFTDELGIKWARRYELVLDLSRGKPWARWFVGGELNIADQLEDSSRTLVKWIGEDGSLRRMSYSEVLYKSRSVASWLRRNGLARGDRVAIYMPMVPEIVPVFLGIIRAGGIVVPLFSGFGKEAIRVRLMDSEAKFVFTSDVQYRRGREISMINELREASSSVTTIALERSRGTGDAVSLNEVFRTGGDFVDNTSSEDPFMIIYTSGTTGKPKGTVHVHGGFPIKAAADIYFHFDMKPNDTLMWITDIGWMMGPWLILGPILLRGTMAIMEGAPDYPENRLWDFVNEERITILGFSATLIRSLRSKGYSPRIEGVRIFGNTGEPIDKESWLWLYSLGKGQVPIINYSGGTEISGGILGCYITKPIKPSSFNGPSPGMKVAILDEEGKPVPPNVEGELVVLSVWPGMTRGFWRDPERYITTYWSRWSDVWVHGDAAVIDEEGYYYIVGRSDDTMKVAGKRIGPAELETILNSHPAVAESACVGIPDTVKGEVPLCLVVLREGLRPSEDLKGELMNLVGNSLGKAFLPADIVFVKELPKTRNAKIMRRVIRALILGKEPGDLSALENPWILGELKSTLMRRGTS